MLYIFWSMPISVFWEDNAKNTFPPSNLFLHSLSYYQFWIRLLLHQNLTTMQLRLLQISTWALYRSLCPYNLSMRFTFQRNGTIQETICSSLSKTTALTEYNVQVFLVILLVPFSVLSKCYPFGKLFSASFWWFALLWIGKCICCEEILGTVKLCGHKCPCCTHP